MSIDPTQVYAILRDEQIVHVRLSKGVAEACATLEKQLYEHETVKVVPVVLTEITGEEYKEQAKFAHTPPVFEPK